MEHGVPFIKDSNPSRGDGLKLFLANNCGCLCNYKHPSYWRCTFIGEFIDVTVNSLSYLRYGNYFSTLGIIYLTFLIVNIVVGIPIALLGCFSLRNDINYIVFRSGDNSLRSHNFSFPFWYMLFEMISDLSFLSINAIILSDKNDSNDQSMQYLSMLSLAASGIMFLLSIDKLYKSWIVYHDIFENLAPDCCLVALMRCYCCQYYSAWCCCGQVTQDKYGNEFRN